MQNDTVNKNAEVVESTVDGSSKVGKQRIKNKTKKPVHRNSSTDGEAKLLTAIEGKSKQTSGQQRTRYWKANKLKLQKESQNETRQQTNKVIDQDAKLSREPEVKNDQIGIKEVKQIDANRGSKQQKSKLEKGSKKKAKQQSKPKEANSCIFTLLRRTSDSEVNSASACVICHEPFKLSDDLHKHMPACIALRPNETLKQKVFAVKINQIHGFLSNVLVYNNSAAVLLLRTVHITGRNGSFLPIFRNQSVLRMVPGYCYEEEVNFESIVKNVDNSDDWNVSFTVVAVPMVGKSRTHEIVAVYRLKYSRNSRRIPLVLPRLPEYDDLGYVERVYDCKFNKKATIGLQEMKILATLENAKNRSSLASRNYKVQTKTLNEIEDIHLRTEFRKYTITNPVLKHDSGRHYTISIDQFSPRPSLITEDTEVIVFVERASQEKKIYGIVDRLDSTKIVLLMEKSIQLNQVLKIRFIDDRTTFKMEYKALELMDHSVIDRMLFPQLPPLNSGIIEHSSFNWFRQSITSNQEQMTAVRNIVNRTSFPAPYILLGPPGTGKTATLVEAIAQIYKLCPDKNVLVTATSNFAANEITERLLEFVPSTSVYRFFAKTAFRKVNYIKESVLQVSNFQGKQCRETCYEDIYDNRVIICTLTTAGRLVQAKISKDHFSYIFIDECGSAKEISALVPIINIGTDGSAIKASVILAGDPKQLGPVIQYDLLNSTTHSVSMLERMIELDFYQKDSATGQYNSQLITLLRNNYRSHQALLHFPNHTFYSGELRAEASPHVTNWAIGWHRLPNRKFPMIFHSIRGELKTSEYSFSLYNPIEIDQVVFYVNDILKHGINSRTVKQHQIGVISPYARQVFEIKEIFCQREWRDIEVGSTEQFQGREKDIIIISTVRSNSHVGFLGNTKRLNVTITRARALMIIVGDQLTLQRNTHWRQLITYCYQNYGIVRKEKKALKPKTIPVRNLEPISDTDLEKISHMMKSLVVQTLEQLKQNQTTGGASKAT